MDDRRELRSVRDDEILDGDLENARRKVSRASREERKGE